MEGRLHSTPTCIRGLIRVTAAASLAVFALAASEYHGQIKLGGQPVPGVTVTAARGETKIVAITDQQGVYSFPDLADGVWTVQVEMLCFVPAEREVNIAPGAPADEWNLKLLPRNQLEAMATAFDAPAAPAAAAPQNGFAQANLNTVASTAKPAKEAKPAENDLGDAGDLSQKASDGLLINGTVNNGAASPFGQAAAFGNNRFGNRWRFHGTAGLFFNNSALDARPFSLTGQDTPKAAYSHFEGLASIGGPLLIPGLFRGDNAPSFFISYQRTQLRDAMTQTALVPTLDERNGNFAQTLNAAGKPVAISDPATGAPFQNNAISDGMISAQARALLALYPKPNFASSSRYNYQTPIMSRSNQDDLQARINKSAGRLGSLAGSFAYRNNRGENPNLFGFLDTSGTSGINASVSLSPRLGARTFATLKYDFSRLAVKDTPYFANRENISGHAGIMGDNQDPGNWGPPSLSFSSGIAGLSDGQQSYTRNQTGALSFDATSPLLQISHSLKVGGIFRRAQFNLLSQQNARGAFAFTGAATGYDFADFLLGIPATSSIAFGNADKYLRQSVYAAYMTDDWRVTSGLTANVGFRWEYESPVTERYGRLVNLDVTSGFGAIAPVVANAQRGSLTGRSYPNSLIAPDKHGFEPRIGIAWRPFAASSLVVRAGYGIYYNTSMYQSIAMQMIQQAPLSKSLSVQNTAANPLTLANGFNAPPSLTPNTFAVDPNFQAGYAQNWNVSLQRDLPGSLVMLATYLGTKGTRGAQQFLPNTYPAGALNPCPACPSGFTYLTSNGNSTREAGQIQLRRRLHNGFTASVQYAFAKAIDDSAPGGSTPAIAQNWLDLRAERALSNFDQRHQLNLQLQYTTGMGIGGGALLGGMSGKLLKGWTVTSQMTAASGMPLTPIYFTPVKGTGVTGTVRPDYTGAPVYDAPPGLHLNPAAYAPPHAAQWGNAGRNSIRGPAQFALNASLSRTFQFTDRVSTDLRFDATNVLNHVTYPSWNTTVTSLQFGLPMSANQMRKVQAVLRARF